ncbi:hypothetical protein ACQCX5_06945 [Propionibacteriaceae bacterium G57]|uniref:hypothetical protein n=1 Tax=Aestuariimicrobium sp. G57 TaxID=3418485 RepID=UPI003DA72DF4
MTAVECVRVPARVVVDQQLSADAVLMGMVLDRETVRTGLPAGWVSTTYQQLLWRCGWDGLSPAAASKKVSRALRSLLDAGYLRRRGLGGSGRSYQLTSLWGAGDVVEVPAAQVYDAIGLGARVLRHWLLLRLLVGPAGISAAPIVVESRQLGIRPATVSRQRRQLAAAGLIEVREVVGYESLVSTVPVGGWSA